VNQLSNFDKVLVLSPHTDDAELGAGGTIARFIDEGKEVHYIVFSFCETSVPEGLPKDILIKECKISLKNLGIIGERIHMLNYQVRTFPEHRQEILDYLIKFKSDFVPDLVLVPSSQDMHQDHGVIYWEALRAFKKDSSIWGYEHPWNNLTFTNDIFISLNEEHLGKKIRALREYKSQRSRSYMDERNIRSLAITRGSQLDLPYAEVFELIRLIY
jgi:LmbE family N-acetylglucosaminyl deacetylase